MSQTGQGTQENSQPPGWAPWGTQRRMKRLAVTSVLLCAVVLALGIFLTITHHDGIRLIVLAAILIAVLAAAIPIARRRGTM